MDILMGCPRERNVPGQDADGVVDAVPVDKIISIVVLRGGGRRRDNRWSSFDSPAAQLPGGCR